MEATCGSTLITSVCCLSDILNCLGVNRVTIFLIKLLKICIKTICLIYSHTVICAINEHRAMSFDRESQYIDRDQLLTKFRHKAVWKDRHKPQTKQKHTYRSHWERSGKITFGLALCLISKAHLSFFLITQFNIRAMGHRASPVTGFLLLLPSCCLFILFIYKKPGPPVHGWHQPWCCWGCYHISH